MTHVRFLAAGAAALLALVFVLDFHDGVSRADGGDFSLDLVAAAPETYFHGGPGGGTEVSTGSLQYDSRDINLYVRESLEAEDFTCEDRAIFFTQVTTDAGAVGSQEIEISYEFDAEPTGQPAVGYSDIVAVGISGPSGFPGQQSAETGNQNLDGNELATLSMESIEPPGSTLGVDAQTVAGTVKVSGLEAGDVAIVRVDVRFSCFPTATDPTGTLHANIAGAQTSLGDNISVGQQDIPMLNLGVIQTATPTATSTPTPTSTPSAPGATPTPTGPAPLTPSPTPGTGAPPSTPASAPPASYPPGVQPPDAGLGVTGSDAWGSLAALLLGAGVLAIAAGAMRKRRAE